jgi:hypothetical protein
MIFRNFIVQGPIRISELFLSAEQTIQRLAIEPTRKAALEEAAEICSSGCMSDELTPAQRAAKVIDDKVLRFETSEIEAHPRELLAEEIQRLAVEPTRNAALEEAAKAICEGCAGEWPFNSSSVWHIDHGATQYPNSQMLCKAIAIRALKRGE